MYRLFLLPKYGEIEVYFDIFYQLNLEQILQY